MACKAVLQLLILCCALQISSMYLKFLPQLLLYPNPTDPLNGEAAALMMRDRDHYEQKVKGASILSLKVLSVHSFNMTTWVCDIW